MLTGNQDMKIWKIKSEVDKYDNLEPMKDFSVEEYWKFDGHELKCFFGFST